MHEIYPHPVVPFPPRKIPAAIWSFCEGSGVGFGAGQGLRLEAQGTAGRGLQDPGPWPPASQQAVCPWGGVRGFRERREWWALEGRG